MVELVGYRDGQSRVQLRDHSTLLFSSNSMLVLRCIMKLIMKKKYIAVLGITSLLVTLLGPVLRAAADQGFYVIDKSARPGMLVTVSATDPNVAEPATMDKAAAMVGVLGDEPTSFDIQDGQQNVLTGGVRDTLVSTIYGDIKKGNYVTASSIVGFGGRLVGSGWVVGIAQADFNSSTQGAVKSSVSDATGKQQDVYVGSIPVLIKVLYYDETQAVKERDISFIPEDLQRAIDSIAGRRASQIAVVLASILLLVGLFIGGIITHSAIKNGIKSTARQPLAKKAIFLRMVQSCLIGLGIILATIIGAFVIVRII